MLLFRKQKRQFAVVINEYGDLMGIITLYNILEQIIGNFAEDDNEKNLKRPSRRKRGFQMREAELSDVQNNNEGKDIKDIEKVKTEGDNLTF